jgi:hypothetical protein
MIKITKHISYLIATLSSFASMLPANQINIFISTANFSILTILGNLKEFGTDKKTSNNGKEKHPTLKKTELISSLNDSVDHIHVQDLQQQQCMALTTYCNNPTNFINS